MMPACTQTQVLGLCWCSGAPCGYRVRMYVPVAFVETVRAPGDSLLAASLPSLASMAASIESGVLDGAPTASAAHSGLDRTAEVHAWALGDAAWAMAGAAPCLQCRPANARSAPPAAHAAASLPCGPAVMPAADLLGSLLAGWSAVLPTLVYASEADALNWRTGCRDQIGLALGQLAIAPGLGQWGPLYPRQMRDLGTGAVVYSAKTAYRALSIARDQLAAFTAPVDLAAHMQQAYPVVSACFKIGEQPLPEATTSAQPVSTSADGRYGWFYWRPVSCCVGLDSLARCAAGNTPLHR